MAEKSFVGAAAQGMLLFNPRLRRVAAVSSSANVWCKLAAETINEDDECWHFTRLRDANNGDDLLLP